MGVPVDFDPFSPEVVADPYPWYKQLLEEGPVHWIAERNLYMVVGHDEVSAVLRDPVVYSSNLGYAAMSSGAMSQGADVDMKKVVGLDMTTLRQIISTDLPEHTRVRRLISRAFTPRAIAELEPRLRTTCTEMVHALISKAAGGEPDLVKEVAVPFPVSVIAELLGVSRDRHSDFRRWSDALAGALSGNLEMDGVIEAGTELMTFLAEVVEERQIHPGSDLVSRLLAAGDEDDPDTLTVEEVITNSVLLLVAGSETTTNLIGNAVSALGARPDQAELLLANPEMLPGAIEEVLRWDSPVQGLCRGTTRATTLAGVDLPKDALVFVSFAAANRDPSHFEDPDRFDIRRSPRDHIAFGHGIHHCIGAALARIEARLFFETLLEAGTVLVPTDAAVRSTNVFLRGFQSLPVTCASADA